jgi:hypothetical protein
MNRLLIFFFLNIFASQAQTDSVRLVDIQSSECGGMYHVEPHFLRKETIGDTTYISLSCSNNCGGYHDPSVELQGDSIFIIIHAGEKEMRPFIRYKVNGVIYSEDDLRARERKYDKKYSRADTVSVMEEVHILTTCDCCYIFDLKISGLDSTKAYSYFYNDHFIDPNYKEPVLRKYFEFPYFLKEPKSEVCKKTKRIVAKNKTLLKPPRLFLLSVNLHVDTLDGKIESVTTSFDRDKSNQSINQKLKDYFYSLAKIDCVTNPYNGKLIADYRLFFEYYPQAGELNMSYESRWRLSDD